MDYKEFTDIIDESINCDNCYNFNKEKLICGLGMVECNFWYNEVSIRELYNKLYPNEVQDEL